MWLPCVRSRSFMRRRMSGVALISGSDWASNAPSSYPPTANPGYIGLRRGASEIVIVSWDWSAQRYGLKPPADPRFEMYVYVYDLDTLVTDLRNDGIPVLANVADMPWGERVATIVDPDGNPVTLCLAQDG